MIILKDYSPQKADFEKKLADDNKSIKIPSIQNINDLQASSKENMRKVIRLRS